MRQRCGFLLALYHGEVWTLECGDIQGETLHVCPTQYDVECNTATSSFLVSEMISVRDSDDTFPLGESHGFLQF